MRSFSQSVVQTVHDWVVNKLSSIFVTAGYRVKTHKITPAVGNECEDIEIKDYIVLPHGEDNNLHYLLG